VPVVELERTYTAEAAHHLPKVAPGHKCGRVHGHSYRITVHVAGEIGADGMVLDFAEIDRVVTPIIDAYIDHHCLNDVLANPTSECLAVWIWGRIIRALPGLTAVTVSETSRSAATYRGDA
jgi:6-pyruvoyltetrahydropterin/6-carboxytetrahydropterin synthase